MSHVRLQLQPHWLLQFGLGNPCVCLVTATHDKVIVRLALDACPLADRALLLNSSMAMEHLSCCLTELSNKNMVLVSPNKI